MKVVIRSPFGIAALCIALVIVWIVLTRPAPDKVETSRTVNEPASEPSTTSLLAADPPIDAGDGELPEAPAALGLVAPDSQSPRDLRAPARPEFGGQTGNSSTAGTESSSNAVNIDELWDDSTARQAPSTTSPIRAPESTTTTIGGQTPEFATNESPTSTTSSTKPAPEPKVTAAPASSTAAPTTTTAPSTTTDTTSPPTTTAPTTSTTAAPTTTIAPTTAAPTPKPVGTKGRAGYIAPSAPTYIPVYDTAWQMLVRSTPAQADNYFAALKANGFTGTWSGIIHHAPATYNLNFAGGGQVGSMQNGNLVLNDAYVAHVRSILNAADRHGMKVGLVAAWQNLYLPGGGADKGVGSSDAVRGTITTANAYAYGRHIAEKFGDHPAVSMWVFGGDAGTNNTNANKAVWREMARGVRDAGNGLSITYHTPTSEFDQLNYAGEPWLDFIAPETGHAQDAATTESELRSVKSAYGLPVWQGEPRYFNINFDWVNSAFRNPGVNEVRSDAQAAENAGVSGYVYGDAGRWTWCAGYGDSTPCSPNNVAGSFGAGEAAVIEVFTG